MLEPEVGFGEGNWDMGPGGAEVFTFTDVRDGAEGQLDPRRRLGKQPSREAAQAAASGQGRGEPASRQRAGEGTASGVAAWCVWQNHLIYPGSSALAITIKATPTQTHFKRNNSWSVG